MKSIKNYIKESKSDIVLLSILFLFFLPLISDLVEAIYMLDLLNTSLDEKVLGVLFLITPLFLLFFKKGFSSKLLYIIAELVIIFRVINPFMDTSNKILLSGLGVGCFLIFIPAYLLKVKESDEEPKSVNLGLALASAVLLSITFRALLSSIDISTYSWFQVVGWILAVISSIIVIGRFNIPVEKNDSKINPQNSNKSEK